MWEITWRTGVAVDIWKVPRSVLCVRRIVGEIRSCVVWEVRGAREMWKMYIPEVRRRDKVVGIGPPRFVIVGVKVDFDGAVPVVKDEVDYSRREQIA